MSHEQASRIPTTRRRPGGDVPAPPLDTPPTPGASLRPNLPFSAPDQAQPSNTLPTLTGPRTPALPPTLFETPTMPHLSIPDSSLPLAGKPDSAPPALPPSTQSPRTEPLPPRAELFSASPSGEQLLMSANDQPPRAHEKAAPDRSEQPR